jgi:hypothetical protein
LLTNGEGVVVEVALVVEVAVLEVEMPVEDLAVVVLVGVVMGDMTEAEDVV